MKIAIIDKLGLCYDGDTLSKQGLGGSESAVILVAAELAKIGFDVTVYNNCKDGSNSKPGVYNGVRYIDNSEAKNDTTVYDIAVVSRTVAPFVSTDWPLVQTAKKRILWLHDTFIEGDQIMEDLVVAGKIDHIFTLSDWHTSYILTCAHGKKRNYEVLKKKIFQTRNGAVCHIPEVDLSKKDPKHFVYNASATKGMIPLVDHIWPAIKKKIPDARLSVIGGYYRFREGAKPDAQENTVEQLSKRQDLKDLDVTFTGVIPQHEIAQILANAWMMIYPGAFPETFGISSLESLLYKTPLVTTRFGALEETAIDLACYHIDYAIEPNSLFPHINKEQQVQKFLDTFFRAYSTPYLHQQKQNYCEVVKDIAGWDTVALQWKQFFYSTMSEFLPVDEYRQVSRINQKVARVFGRTSTMPFQKEYRSYGEQRRIVVVSPFWNAANYIEKHIRSVASQDYSNYLHILINDASTDLSKRTAESAIKNLKTNKTILINNQKNNGAVFNQISIIKEYVKSDDIVVLLDGDDWLINNNSIFHYYNDLYNQGYEFTYGSMWSLVDNIPLIAQEYPTRVKENKSYRTHLFNWKIPYTHLRTCLGKHFKNLGEDQFKIDGKWMKSGADNPLFYELIEQVEPSKIYCNREIVCVYNDANPLNDYKIRAEEQNRNANRSYANTISFEDLVKGKTVAVVGNAKSLERSQFGDCIDQHEIVIRFNRALEYPFNARSHGSKTDVWVMWRAGEYKNIISLHKDKKMIQAAYFLDSESDQIEVAPQAVYTDLFDQIGKDPSSGLVILEWLNRLDPKSVDVYGFDWKKTPTIHADKTSKYIDNLHDFEKEKNIVRNYKFNIMEKNLTKKILIGIPTNKYIEVETFQSLWDLEVPEGYELDFQYFYGYQIDQIRNLVSEWAKKYDYLLSVDSDIILPKDALVKMLAADKDIISGLYIQRIPNTHTLEVYMDTAGGGCTNIPYELIKNRGVVEIAACGMGAALIKSQVFRDLQYPHFFYKSALTMKDTVSEDVYFCKKARAAGFKVWADASIKCDHKGSNFFVVDTPKTHLEKVADQDLLPLKHSEYLKTMQISPKVVYDIGACVQHWTRKAKQTWPNSKYYLVDAAKSVERFLKTDPYAIVVLSDSDGKIVDFYEDPNNPGGNSYYKETTGAFTDDHKSRRITVTLDTLVKENNWDLPELIKIDVQGAEIDVLKGAATVIAQCRDIILEAQHVNYNEGAPKFLEVKAYLESIGFGLKAEIVRNSIDADYHFVRTK